MIQPQEPPVILKPSENQSEQEALEISITKLLLNSYYDIVRIQIEDIVPKKIMHFMANHTKRELHNIFIRKLYRENFFNGLLREPDDIVVKRKMIKETLRVLQQAYKRNCHSRRILWRWVILLIRIQRACLKFRAYLLHLTRHRAITIHRTPLHRSSKDRGDEPTLEINSLPCSPALMPIDLFLVLQWVLGGFPEAANKFVLLLEMSSYG